jgi:epoxyqueuosine reductase
MNLELLVTNIEKWSAELGFSQVGICDVDLSKHEDLLKSWLENNYHGDMGYMERHGLMRARPSELVPGSIRAISVRLDYLPTNAQFSKTLKAKDHAYISRYALGRDYHKLMRKRLQQLGKKISEHCAEFNFRALVDSAPILERPLAEKAGLGWVGKHSLLINKEAGSWFFIGELLVDIPLPLSKSPTSVSSTNDCGKCVACIKICPTQAIIKPYVVDARRCISYFTIESSAAIPMELRPMMGNRIYGCDDCQLICPWNKYAKLSMEKDFQQRNKLDQITLLELFQWNEQHFLSNLEGSPIRRIGFESWQRNISVALGNAPYDKNIVEALKSKLCSSSELVSEHIEWALEQQNHKKTHLIDHLVNHSNEKLNVKLIRSVEVSMPRDA